VNITSESQKVKKLAASPTRGRSGSSREKQEDDDDKIVNFIARSIRDDNVENTIDLIEPWEFSI